MTSLQVNQSTTQTRFLIDDWVSADWKTFAQLVEKPEYQDCKAYYRDVFSNTRRYEPANTQFENFARVIARLNKRSASPN